MENIEVISCAPKELYSDGGFYDSDIGLGQLIDMSMRHAGNINILAEIFSAQQVEHPSPAVSITSDAKFANDLADHLHHVQSSYTYLPPSLLVRIRNAIVWQNMIFALVGNRAIPIYEFYRAIDRNEKGRHLLSRLAACEKHERLILGDTSSLFVGSAGSFNYGHWLVDDFPSLAAVRDLRRNGKNITLFMSSFFDNINRTRIEGTALALGEYNNYNIKMLDRTTAYHIRNLHYVTPSSYHPFLKNSDALRFVRETCSQTLFDEPSCAASDKLFVNRAEGEPRRLVNNDAVVAQMKVLGFTEFYPEKFSLREQWATFINAKQVVGVMGAAMTSSLLCPAGTKLTYLSPMGWIEPFYWTLSTMSDQPYCVLFGPSEHSSADAYRRNFFIDTSQLTDHLLGS